MFEKFKLNGRYSKENDKLFFYNVGSGVAFKINGNSFSFFADFSNKDGYLSIIVDRKYDEKNKILINNSKKVVFDFKNSGTHYVDIVKVNEANDNTLSVSDFEFDGELLDYDFNYTKKVRVFGDSTIAGFGILAHEGDASVHTSDGVEDFCYRSLYSLSSDMEIFASSGWGLKFSEYTNPKTLGIYDFKDCVSTSFNKPWNKNNDFDLLIISLGTNDWSYIKTNKNMSKNLAEKFQDTYLNLILNQLKGKDAPVIMLYGTLDEKEVFPLIEETYILIKNKVKNLKLIKLNGSSDAISNHAYVDTHKRISEDFKKVLKKLI